MGHYLLLLLLKLKCERECGSDAYFRLNVNGPIVLVNDLFGECKSQADATAVNILGGLEEPEELKQFFLVVL